MADCEAARPNFEKTHQFMEILGGVGGLALNRRHVSLVFVGPSDVLGFRNFSLVHDQSQHPQLIEELFSNSNIYRLLQLF